MATVKLSLAVSYFFDTENYGDAEYAKAYRIAVRCLRNEIELDIDGKICKAKLCIGKDKIAKLPDNFIREVDVDYSRCLEDGFENIDDTHLDSFITDFRPPYTIDRKKGIITFQPDYEYDEVEFEYLGREELCGDTEIDDRLTDVIVTYLKWQWEIGRKGNSAGTIDYYKREFYRAKDNAKFRIGRPTNQQLIRNSRVHTYYGLKR